MINILKYVLQDIIRNRTVLGYSLLLSAFSWTAFGLEDNVGKGMLTLLNIILLIVPLVSILFSTIYVYNSNEFVELLLSHPIKRSKIWVALFLGLGASLSVAFLLGAGIPILVFAGTGPALLMICMGVLITFAFTAIAFLCSIASRDKAKGIGIAIITWLFFSLLFDGLVLFLLFQLSDYPIEKMMVGITALNPIDLSRILMLLQLDVSAMMGYTGAIFKDFFGTQTGLALSLLLLLLWSTIPFCISLTKFKRKDL